jgi:DNA (cytosine-5)-methyltransferase 1
MDPKDPRSTLVWHFLRLVEGLSPEAFVMENVKALGVLKKWSGVRHSLVQRFESLGYSVSVNILTASHYGVPQARERVFFVGLKGGKGELRLRRQKPTSVRSILETLPPPGQSPNLGACRARIVPAKRPVLRRSPYAGMLFNGQGRPIDLSAACNTLPASMGGNRTPIVDEMELRQGAEPWVVGYHARLISGGMLEAVAPERLRRLSVTEASLLQCFPRGYVFAGSQCSQYRQIGNAVPPPLAQAVAQALLEIL